MSTMRIMKQKKLPPHYGEDMGMSKLEILELIVLMLFTVCMGVGVIAFIISALTTAKDLVI